MFVKKFWSEIIQNVLRYLFKENKVEVQESQGIS